jgi:hypothetical protein
LEATVATDTCYAVDRPSFSVRVDGGFVDHGQWLIHGVVAYRRQRAAKPRINVEAIARRELILALAQETRTARALGARSVFVVVDGDDEVAGFFRMLDPHPGR